MDPLRPVIVLTALALAFWIISYFWLLTHRISVRIDKNKARFSTLEDALRFVLQRLDRAQSDQHHLGPTEDEFDWLKITILGQQEETVCTISFTGPDQMISALAKGVRESKTYRGMTGQLEQEEA